MVQRQAVRCGARGGGGVGSSTSTSASSRAAPAPGAAPPAAASPPLLPSPRRPPRLLLPPAPAHLVEADDGVEARRVEGVQPLKEAAAEDRVARRNHAARDEAELEDGVALQLEELRAGVRLPARGGAGGRSASGSAAAGMHAPVLRGNHGRRACSWRSWRKAAHFMSLPRRIACTTHFSVPLSVWYTCARATGWTVASGREARSGALAALWLLGRALIIVRPNCALALPRQAPPPLGSTARTAGG